MNQLVNMNMFMPFGRNPVRVDVSCGDIPGFPVGSGHPADATVAM
jgi:hypothetical protein